MFEVLAVIGAVTGSAGLYMQWRGHLRSRRDATREDRNRQMATLVLGVRNGPDAHHLTLTNRGPADARDIVIRVSGDYTYFEPAHRLDFLAANHDKKWGVVSTYGDLGVVSWEWTDGTGQQSNEHTP